MRENIYETTTKEGSSPLHTLTKRVCVWLYVWLYVYMSGKC